MSLTLSGRPPPGETGLVCYQIWRSVLCCVFGAEVGAGVCLAVTSPSRHPALCPHLGPAGTGFSAPEAPSRVFRCRRGPRGSGSLAPRALPAAQGPSALWRLLGCSLPGDAGQVPKPRGGVSSLPRAHVGPEEAGWGCSVPTALLGAAGGWRTYSDASSVSLWFVGESNWFISTKSI